LASTAVTWRPPFSTVKLSRSATFVPATRSMIVVSVENAPGVAYA